VKHISQLILPVRGGHQLAATLLQPEADESEDSGQPVVVINSDMGVRRAFYNKFAQFLQAEGFNVITYDYRGMGDSRPKKLRGFPAALRDWGENDIPGIIDWARNRFPGAPIFAIGHGAGALMMGLAGNISDVDAIIAVSAPLPCWRLFDGAAKRRIWFQAHIMLPAAAFVFGYVPGKRLGLGEDLPMRVAVEWAQWCRTPNHVYGDPAVQSRLNIGDFTGPLLAYSFTDDAYAPGPAVEALLKRYRNARINHSRLTPQEIGAEAVGHLGFFRPQFRDALWRQAAAWLRQRHE